VPAEPLAVGPVPSASLGSSALSVEFRI